MLLKYETKSIFDHWKLRFFTSMHWKEKQVLYHPQLFNSSQIMTLATDLIHLAVVGLNKLNKTHNRGLDGNYDKKIHAMYIKLAAFELLKNIYI